MLIYESKKNRFAEDVLLLLEHPPTVTLDETAIGTICWLHGKR